MTGSADRPPPPPAPAAGDVATATVTVELDGLTTVVPWPAGTRLLDALLDAGLDAPYSCREGHCGACTTQLASGEVELAHNEVLDASDLADGYILACQAISRTARAHVVY